MRVRFRRPDGSFVIELDNGWPYHVPVGDPAHAAVAAAAANETIPEEPPPPAIERPEREEPTLETIQARLDALAADLALLKGR